MNKRRKFTLGGVIRSIGYGARGIHVVVASQPNAWIHAVVTVLVVIAGLYFGFTNIEWVILVITIILVWAAESLNSAVEYLADLVSPDYHPLIRKTKDAAAGGVLITAIGSVIIGIIIIGPYILELFRG
ncbi:MAG: diacylglycerol kinase family protein [Chloroflexota bacterium]|nr:diacylglycerol kinase family protein [Chloroflexota bacterium]